MDGVEEPMVVSAVGGKGLDPERFVEIGDEGCGEGSVGVEGEMNGRIGAAECCSRKDTKQQTVNLEYASFSQDERSEDVYGRLHHSFKQEANDTSHHSGESEYFHSSPMSECKKLQRNYAKGLNISPTSKRPRTDQMEDHSGSYITKCTTYDKLRLPKDSRQKLVQDGKKCERKNSRVMGKVKPDSFVWKNGSSPDLCAGGNNIIGIHGIKLDFHDCTKDVDEPSLTALLDGSYDFPTSCQSKGKKGSCGPENIILAVRKACSVLPQHVLIDSSNKESPACDRDTNHSPINVTEHGGGDRSTLESMPSIKANNMDIMDQPHLYKPGDLLERLSLPRVDGLFSTLQDHNSMSTDILHRTKTLDVCKNGLPSFSWSSIGSCKPSTDSGKSATNRYMGQSRWVRIGNFRSENGEGSSCFSELVPKAVDLVRFPSTPKSLGELLQDAKSLAVSFSLPLHGLAGTSCEAVDATKSSILENDMYSSAHKINNYCGQIFPNCRAKSSDSCLDCDTKEIQNRGKEAECSLWYQKYGAEPADPSSITFRMPVDVISDQEDGARVPHGYSKNNLEFSCQSGKGGRRPSWQSSTTEISKAVHSPQDITAAEILLEMAHSGVLRKLNRLRWPSPPLRIVTKARHPKPPLVKMEGSLPEARSSALPPKTIKVSSPQHKSIRIDKRNKLPFMKNPGRESVRWSTAADGMYPPKPERESSVSSKTPYTNPAKQVDFMLAPPRIEKGRDNHHKPRKDMMSMPSYTKPLGVKDWSRGRSRRE